MVASAVPWLEKDAVSSIETALTLIHDDVTASAGFFRHADVSSRYTNVPWLRQETRSFPDCVLVRIVGACVAGECSSGQHYRRDERAP